MKLKIKTKILAIMLIAVMCICMMTVPSRAEDTYTATTKTSEGVTVKWSYELSDDKVVNLKCTNKSEINGKVEIPSTIDGKTVISIGKECFYDATGITEVVIPNTVAKIYKRCF